MSVTHDVRTEPQPVEIRRRGRSAALATRVNRALFTPSRWPWVMVDLVLVAGLYELGIRFSPWGDYRDLVSPYVALSVVYSIAFAAIALGLGHYDRESRFGYYSLVRNTLAAAFLASLVNLAFHYFTLYAVVGRLTLVYGAAFSVLGMIALRAALAVLVRRHPYRFTVIGAPGPISATVREWAQQDRQATLFDLVRWDTIFRDPARPTVDELRAACIAQIVVASDTLTDEVAVDSALLALKAGVPVVEERSFYAGLFERMPIDEMSKRWILEHGLARPQAVVAASKRLADIMVAAVGLLVASPVLLLAALGIRLTSPGPVLFVQERQGRFNQPFRMLKFRTMTHVAEPVDGGFTRAGDDRVFPFGRFLRRTHLDELPQLWNIFRGQMSLVGPRPETLEFAQRMDAQLPLYELRYLVRPGLTGHAQLKQGYAMDTVLDTQDKLSYDLYYLCNYSLRLDLRILLRTALFLTRGAR